MSYGNGNGYGNRQGSSGYRNNAGGGGYRQFTPRAQGAGQGQGQRKDNQGSFKENPNRNGPNSPKFKGSMMVAGRLYFVSVWDDHAPEYFSIKVTAADEANQSRPQSAPSRGGYQQHGGVDPELDDNLPF